MAALPPSIIIIMVLLLVQLGKGRMSVGNGRLVGMAVFYQQLCLSSLGQAGKGIRI